MKKNLLKIALGVALFASTSLLGQNFTNIVSPDGVDGDGFIVLKGGSILNFDYNVDVPASFDNAPFKILLKLKNSATDNFSDAFIAGNGVAGQGPVILDVPATPAGTNVSFPNLEIRLGAIGENSANGTAYAASNYEGSLEGIEGAFFPPDFSFYAGYAGATFYGEADIDFIPNNPLSTNSFDSITSKLSPNPTNGELRLDDSVEYKSVSVYDMVGKKVMQVAKSSSLDVSSLDKGVYVLVTDTNLKGKFVKN
jgi:hypothetical protein